MPSVEKIVKDSTKSLKKTKKAKAAPVVVAPVVESSSSDSSSEEEEVAAPVVVAPTKESKKSKTVAAAPVKEPKKPKTVAPVVESSDSSSSDSSSSDSSSEEEEVAAPVVVAPTKESKKSKTVAAAPVKEPKKPKTIAPVVESSDSSSSDSSSDSESEVSAPKSTESKAESSDDSDSSSDSSSDSETEAVAPTKRAAETTEAPMKKTKTEEPTSEAVSSLFIGNLGWGVTTEDLRACFEEYGTVTDTRIATDPQTGRSRGFGYVDFESSESAQKGLAASGQDLQGRAMNVDLATSKPKTGGANGRTEDAKTAPTDCLFVGNLSFNSSEDSLAEIFGEYGAVTEVRLPTDRETGRKKGFGYIQFGSVEEATAALQALNGQDVDGRSLRCDYSGPRPAQGDRPERGGRGGSRGGFGGRGGRGGSRGGRGGDRGGRGGFSSRGGSRGGAAFAGKRTVFE